LPCVYSFNKSWSAGVSLAVISLKKMDMLDVIYIPH
jgi:hypothetical protein